MDVLPHYLAIPVIAPLINMNSLATEKILFDFQTATNNAAWQILKDDVMGGVSITSFSVTNGVAVFRGAISLENSGGFASVRSLPAWHDLAMNTHSEQNGQDCGVGAPPTAKRTALSRLGFQGYPALSTTPRGLRHEPLQPARRRRWQAPGCGQDAAETTAERVLARPGTPE